MIEDDIDEAPKVALDDQPRGLLKFKGLVIRGFKSFADAAAFDIEPGLTGVVGPNGCGKSNVFEALRFALGETSAKRMRGGVMDDVIFGGTASRPAKNMCDATLLLDNSSRTAPAELNYSDTLEVVRTAVRGQGTSYKVNGKAVSQKSIQHLFLANASGAASSSIVSQGRVLDLIRARPSDRRLVLEEAAGTSGLSARRHETELKLKQAEVNLDRAEDALYEVTRQVETLQRQSRMLIKYRDIERRLKSLRAGVYLIRMNTARLDYAAAQREHEENERKVQDAILAVKAVTELREKTIAAINPFRDARSIAETNLARAIARLEGVTAEIERRKRDIAEMKSRLSELGTDKLREQQADEEATATVEQLRGEQFELADLQANEDDMIRAASDQVEVARAAMEEVDVAFHAVNSELAMIEASRAAANRNLADAERRHETVSNQLRTAESKLDAARASLPDLDELAAAIEDLAELEIKLEVAVEGVIGAETAAEEARATLEGCMSALAELQARLAQVRAEARGLEAVAASQVSADPVSSYIKIKPGYEAAVAAAFGEALAAGTDDGEEQWWGYSTTTPPTLPPNLTTMTDIIEGVPELTNAAKAIVVVESDGELSIIGPRLPAGAIAVSRGGMFVRWDGYRGRPTTNAVEAGLKRIARLRELQAEIAVLEPQVSRLEQDKARQAQTLAASRQAETEARAAVRSLTEKIRVHRDGVTKAQAIAEQGQRLLAVSESQVGGILRERDIALAALEDASKAVAGIPPDDTVRHRLNDVRSRLQASRDIESQAKIALARLISEQAARKSRAEALDRQVGEWTRRLAQSKERQHDLERRHWEATRALADLETKVASPDDAVVEAKEAADAARTASHAAIKQLADAERERETCEENTRQAEAALSALREDRGRIIAAMGQAQSAMTVVTEAVRDNLNVPHEHLPIISGIDIEGPLPQLTTLENQMQKLEVEKERFGPVNFLADAELQEKDKSLGNMRLGREEIRAAIGKLRQAIKEIEDEARDKLERTFNTIDQNFSQLFVQLFDGGEAHLKLVGTDILEAGLEIYASPPGKKMEVMSLLSGGEQTLTAMALIFAAFMSNPSPICVLDEADAALDDANADRLIRLVEKMAENDATRFLFITHKPITMARMNRLFGVTMQERGVSSLTKVDLDRAVEIAEAPDVH